MSQTDSNDEETKRIQAIVNPDDSKESNKSKKTPDTENDYNWETNSPEDNDDEW